MAQASRLTGGHRCPSSPRSPAESDTGKRWRAFDDPLTSTTFIVMQILRLEPENPLCVRVPHLLRHSTGQTCYLWERRNRFPSRSHIQHGSTSVKAHISLGTGRLCSHCRRLFAPLRRQRIASATVAPARLCHAMLGRNPAGRDDTGGGRSAAGRQRLGERSLSL